ncbi:hypothetical protein IX51_00525 [uncultured archaeon]|nr:hypothetical protein IX51_00525 [uncultured archaeon]HKJ96500.1 hypothetical protein [Thermoplasmataceae archaeon]
MEGQIFVGIIEDWIKGLTKKPRGKEKVEKIDPDTPDSLLQPEDLQHFKSWLSLALRVTDVWSEGISVSPEEVVFSSAVRKTHSRLLKALSMFTDKELLDLFGPERANLIRGVANDVSYKASSTGNILLHSSPDMA